MLTVNNLPVKYENTNREHKYFNGRTAICNIFDSHLDKWTEKAGNTINVVIFLVPYHANHLNFGENVPNYINYKYITFSAIDN